MNYSLGNMLSRGGALNPDGLSLDLAFAADKTLTARKGPTPTFTRASTATFVGSNGLIQSAAINTPRFDHDPVTFACKGLLIEELRTNLCLRSEEFDNATWAKSSAIVTAPVVTANQVNSPSGVLNADRIVFPAVSGAGAFSLAVQLFSQSAGVVYTASIYLRGLVGGEKVWWSWTPNGSTYARKECILTTAWQRFDFTYTSTAGNNFIQLGVDLRDASQSAQLAQTIFAWGAQLEAGSFPTSYIPTTTTALTRSADVCSITGGDFTSFYNPSEGTVLVRAVAPRGYGSALQYIYAISAITSNYLSAVYRNSSREIKGISILSGTDQTLTLIDGILEDGNTSKIAFASQQDNFAISQNASISTDSSGSMVTSLDRMIIGNRVAGDRAWNGHIAAICYYKKRLPDAKLQSLTTP